MSNEDPTPEASALGRRKRRKGKTGEQELARAINAALPGVNARRSFGQSRQRGEVPDIQCDLPIWLESKRAGRPNIYAAIAQAVRECGERPLWPTTATRADGGEWLVTMRLEDWLDLMSEWRAGR